MSSQDTGGFSVPARESGGGLEDGATIQGTILGTGTDEWTSDDGPVVYYQITIDWDIENWERDVGFNVGPVDDPHITPNKEIGALVERFGVDVAEHIENDVPIPLDEIFEPGTRVAFEIEEDTFEGDDDEEVESFNIVKDSLRPEGTDLSGDDTADNDVPAPDDDNLDGQVFNIVEDAQDGDGGAPLGDLRKTLLQESEGKELYDRFQDLTDEGDIVVDDDEVTLA